MRCLHDFTQKAFGMNGSGFIIFFYASVFTSKFTPNMQTFRFSIIYLSIFSVWSDSYSLASAEEMYFRQLDSSSKWPGTAGPMQRPLRAPTVLQAGLTYRSYIKRSPAMSPAMTGLPAGPMTPYFLIIQLCLV